MSVSPSNSVHVAGGSLDRPGELGKGAPVALESSVALDTSVVASGEAYNSAYIAPISLQLTGHTPAWPVCRQ